MLCNSIGCGALPLPFDFGGEAPLRPLAMLDLACFHRLVRSLFELAKCVEAPPRDPSRGTACLRPAGEEGFFAMDV
jgi:hypothetical protein